MLNEFKKLNLFIKLAIVVLMLVVFSLLPYFFAIMNVADFIHIVVLIFIILVLLFVPYILIASMIWETFPKEITGFSKGVLASVYSVGLTYLIGFLAFLMTYGSSLIYTALEMDKTIGILAETSFLVTTMVSGIIMYIVSFQLGELSFSKSDGKIFTVLVIPLYLLINLILTFLVASFS